MERTDEREGRIDRLYALPLPEFTPARDELAARLRREGERAAAAEVKRLRKPSLAAWALNQVRRSSPDQVDALIEAGDRLREAQERLLEGDGREPLERAADDERRLVAELARQAERELGAAGRSVGPSIEERLRGTLHAVATDSEAREGLRTGRLVREYTASGLGPLLGTEPTQPSRRRAEPAPSRKTRQLQERLERARAKQEELEERLSDARRRLSEARREAGRAASALERAEAAEERAGARAGEARQRAAELEAALRELPAAERRGRSRGGRSSR